MAAAAVRPVQRPKRLLLAALLEQELTFVVEQEHRERAMQQACAFVAFGFGAGPDLAVVLVDENQRLRRAGYRLAHDVQCSLPADMIMAWKP